MKTLRRILAALGGPFEGAAPGRRSGLLACLWLLLVGITVMGRLWRPEWNGSPLWNVTPLAGLAVVAGAAFPGRRVLAASAPVAALALGNLAEPAYGSTAMAVTVFAATTWPVLMGRLVRRGWAGAVCGGMAASLGFFVITNAAHWWLTNDYPHDRAGLVACYAAALPFYRPLGDLAWTAVLLVVSVGLVRATREPIAAMVAAVPCPVPSATVHGGSARLGSRPLD